MNTATTIGSPKLSRELLRASWRTWVASDLQRVGPYWLQLLWTFLFCVALAVGFTVLGFLIWGNRNGGWGSLAGWAHWFGKNLIVCQVIGFLIHALFELFGRLMGGAERLARLSSLGRLLYFAGTPILGVAIGWPLGVWLAGGDLLSLFFGPNGRSVLISSLLMSIGISFALYLWFGAKAQQIHAEKQAAEAQLRLLQGQIEPHFLFNTLANVLALMDTDTPKARQMLEAFTEYLRSSLGQLRADEGKLGREFELAERYLRLMQSRMEDRLRFDLQLEPGLQELPLPPLLLQPLVENAIHHGLEPKLEGGAISVRASREGESVLLEVRDNGLGLRQAAARPRGSGHGMALQNLRSRLQSRYGSAASLELVALPQGTAAQLRLPLAPTT
jgi:hypothetical protein